MVSRKEQRCRMSSRLKLCCRKWRSAMCSRFLFVVNNGRQSDFTGGNTLHTTDFSARERIVLSLTFPSSLELECGPSDKKVIQFVQPDI